MNSVINNIKNLLNKKLSREMIIYGGGSFVSAISSFILIPIYIKKMNVAEFGIISLVLTIPLFLNTFQSLSLESAVMRFYFDWEKDNKHKKNIFSVWLFMTLWSFLLSLLLYFFGNKLFFLFFKSIPFDPYIKIAIISSFISVSYNYASKILRITQNAFAYVLISYVSTILKFIFIIVTLVYIRNDSKAALYAILFSDMIIIVPILYILYKNFEFSFSIEAVKQALRFEIPSLPGQIILNFSSIIDRFLLARFFNLQEIGIYMLATKIASLIQMFVNIFQLALTPYYLKLNATIENPIKYISNANKTLFKIIFLISSFLLIFSTEITLLFKKGTDPNLFIYISGLTIVYYFQTLLYNSQLVFFIKSKLLYGTYASALLIGLTIFLSFIFSPIFGLFGLIISMITSSLIVLYCSNLASDKIENHNNFRFDINHAIIILLLITMYLVYTHFTFSLFIGLMFKFILISIMVFFTKKNFLKQFRLLSFN